MTSSAVKLFGDLMPGAGTKVKNTSALRTNKSSRCFKFGDANQFRDELLKAQIFMIYFYVTF
jgi:hypothetical protein